LGKQDQIWAKMFCIPKNMHSHTLMVDITNQHDSDRTLQGICCHACYLEVLMVIT